MLSAARKTVQFPLDILEKHLRAPQSGKRIVTRAVQQEIPLQPTQALHEFLVDIDEGLKRLEIRLDLNLFHVDEKLVGRLHHVLVHGGQFFEKLLLDDTVLTRILDPFRERNGLFNGQNLPLHLKIEEILHQRVKPLRLITDHRKEGTPALLLFLVSGHGSNFLKFLSAHPTKIQQKA